MPTVDELLGLSESTDILTIDNDLRTIDIPKTIKNIGVESDDDVLRLKFKMPRYYCGFDLSEFLIRVNYMNAQKEGDSFEVVDSSSDEEHITFTWLVGRYALKYEGKVIFNVCLRKIDENGMIDREFNTTIATLPVLQGLETTEQIVQDYPDLLEAWRQAWEERLFKPNYAYEAALRHGFVGTEEEWLASLKGAKGDTGIYVGNDEPISYPYFWFDTSGNRLVNTIFTTDEIEAGSTTVFVNLEDQTLPLGNTTVNEEVTSKEQYDFKII